ncbi:MAG TPA: SAM-dependent methyltransferase [Pilimelia sp.]|nr:SAM-dependent methyltransferase [Pilimelia sp.]
MASALYGPGGFFVSGAGGVSGARGPAAHFRTSAHASPLFAGALLRLVARVDEALGHPARLDLVDVGAGGGELLRTLLVLAPPDMAARLRPVGVDLAPRPAGPPAAIEWSDAVPPQVTGVLLATEWLDNVPLDVVEVGPDGTPRYVDVDPAGRESLGGPVSAEDARWLARWWPLPARAVGTHVGAGAVGVQADVGARAVGAQADVGARAEVGRPRDDAWLAAVRAVVRGLALAVDYGHLREARPLGGTLTGYRDGRQVAPVPDGSCDLTAHVAIDSVAAAAGTPYALLSQREAMRALGVDGTRPPLHQASTDPAGYVRALAAASAAAELTDPRGLGGHWWLLHPIGIDPQSITRWTGSPVTREITS